MALAFPQGVRIGRVLLLAAGVLGFVVLVYLLGAGSIVDVLARITWPAFGLLVVVRGLGVAIDTLAWRFTLTGEVPSFVRLFAAKCAGDAVNAVTALGSVGGEPIKVWLLRRELSYEASIPSLILTKTSLVLGQGLLLAVGILVAWTTGIAGSPLLAAMGTLLLVQVVGTGGFLAVQLGGLVGRAGRILAWVAGGGGARAEQLDEALRGFYRDRWRRFVASVATHFAGWLVGVLEALVVLGSLGLPVSVAAATVIEALGCGVRFASFLVPASLGTLEGATVAAFAAFGWAASGGAAFAIIRRACQVVWIGLGFVFLILAGHAPAPARMGATAPAAD
jgi:uncharacterized membrane protein YbhN (UPF0104 family)